ncbi:Uncharacterised protein [Segatella copri]|nr:Uncharacterised protein [Segatella copri]
MLHTLLEVNLLLNHLVEPELHSYLEVPENLPSLECAYKVEASSRKSITVFVGIIFRDASLDGPLTLLV